MGAKWTGPLGRWLRGSSACVLSAAHVLLNRSHPHLASTLLVPLARSGRGLPAARARALRERIRLESGSASVDPERWRRALDDLLGALDARLGGLPTPPPPDVVAASVEALTLAFHPLVHQGGGISPLVGDPEGFGALLDAHPVMARLGGSPASAGAAPVGSGDRGTRAGGCHRLLVLTDTNLAFMGALLDHWRDRPDLEVRARDLAAEGLDPTWWSLRATVADRLGGETPTVPDFLVADLDWADTVWVEWGGALAARLSGCDLDARLLVRLHRYEAFTAYPRLTRWEGVDRLVLVSDLVERALARAVPGIDGRTSISVVPNVWDLSRYRLPKRGGAGHTLALIGWDRPVKDPDWALDVLDRLRAVDPRWRLLLVGACPAPGSDAPTRRWTRALADRVRSLGPAVVRTGFSDDVPEVLRGASVVVSSSLVESAHLALQQGVASGCLPVVRDWPGMRALGGPRALYPGTWIVTTPDEGARRILDASASPRAALHGAADTGEATEASDWVLDHLDAPHVLPLLDAVLSGEGPR